MKKVLFVVLALAMLLSAVSVFAENSIEGKVVAFIPKLTGNSFFEAANDGAQKYAKEWGIEVKYMGSDVPSRFGGAPCFFASAKCPPLPPPSGRVGSGTGGIRQKSGRRSQARAGNAWSMQPPAVPSKCGGRVPYGRELSSARRRHGAFQAPLRRPALNERSLARGKRV